MSRVNTLIVARGVIGNFNISWYVLEQHDTKNDERCYDLHIGGEFVKSYPSVVAALRDLIDCFDE